MKSKILVENDFDNNEPYFQLIIDSAVLPDQQPDMRDVCLKRFVELASYSKISVVYSNVLGENNTPQLRINKIDNRFRLWENSKELEHWLSENKIDFEIEDQSILLAPYVDPFLTGAAYGRYQQLTSTPAIQTGNKI